MGSKATKGVRSKPSADQKKEARFFEPIIDIEPVSLSESSLFIRLPRFVNRFRTGERSPTTLTETEDEERRVGSETVTVMVQETSKDIKSNGARKSVEEDKLSVTPIRAEQD